MSQGIISVIIAKDTVSGTVLLYVDHHQATSMGIIVACKCSRRYLTMAFEINNIF